ncbi:YbaB/EbfC family nucleoid-associated protein [Rhodococcus triatomae]|uniref:YbaB/EbfC DNA-binding family protein n=1 Tax=Rhodococcus triatomae TaxID=300028 RepID=A0A1G8FIS1_9NOCA|nr:YbaB/EbfC family nucleoid-associated protein [Rhodococcus triatomae]QNG19492.1 YbaB/EbfC family nucleoid-associated protein [Rhodococcus triatomae]QNG24593.1 YbaB/EbfC family nucleoid-associated protein [Rhodococcus triatomae]SDH81919.1 YbaB/EbfC DNA-binding family protein [Rhodococcus triatomae]
MSGNEMDAIVARAQEKIGLLEDALDGLGRLRARASDEKDTVTAEVDGNGTLTGLWMDDSIATTDSRALGPLIVATVSEAARLATEQRMELMNRLQDGFESP